MKNYLMTSFAIVGAISLIIMACSAENSINSSASAVGKYQISSSTSSFHVLDTETGVVKTYFQGSNQNYVLYCTTVTQ